MHFEYFLDKIYPLILVVISILGNSLVIIIYSQKYFKNLASRNIWRLIALIDMFCVLQIFKHIMSNVFDIYIYLITPLLCKLVSFFSHFGTISAWLHAYLTAELVCTITLPTVVKRFRHLYNYIIGAIFLLNCLFYAQRFFYTDIIRTDNQTYCGDMEKFKEVFQVFLWIDFINSTMLPFLLMILSSFVLIHTIFKSHAKLTKSYSKVLKRKLLKNIRFSITLVVLNLTFIVLNMPIHLYFLLEGTSNLWFSFFDDLYYSCYAINFFVLFIVNPVFRRELFGLVSSITGEFHKEFRKSKRSNVLSNG